MRTLQKWYNWHEGHLENTICFEVLLYVILNDPSGHQPVQAIGFMAVTFSFGLTGAVILQWRTASCKAQFIQPCSQSKQILSILDWYSGFWIHGSERTDVYNRFVVHTRVIAVQRNACLHFNSYHFTTDRSILALNPLCYCSHPAACLLGHLPKPVSYFWRFSWICTQQYKEI